MDHHTVTRKFGVFVRFSVRRFKEVTAYTVNGANGFALPTQGILYIYQMKLM
jgi:hypothetical protein